MIEHLAFLPDGVSPALAAFLIALSFFTSGMAATFGIGGGVVMMAVMATVLPIQVVVPVHGLVQLGSNTGRVVVYRTHVVPSVFWPVFIGSVLGAIVGGSIAVSLPGDLLRLAVGLVIVWTVWMPLRFPERGGTIIVIGAAMLSMMLAMLVGIAGALAMSIVATFNLPRMNMIATGAAAIASQHLLKVIAFGVLGFAFWPWLPMIVAMIASGFLGTIAGSYVLRGMSEEWFQPLFRLVMTAVAFQLIYRGVMGMFGY